jgi:Flp pilus assembly protein TadG
MAIAVKRPFIQHLQSWLSDEGAPIVELAVSLPLLIVLVVGIFDFGGAFNLKEELGTAVREGARFGAAQPTNDLCGSCNPPASVNAIASLVDSYLIAARINDCGLSTVLAGSPSGSGPPWTYTAATACAGTLTLTIARDPTGTGTTPTCSLSMSNYGGVTVNAPCTVVTISYPYQWHFNNVIQLISPGSSLGLTNIQTNATVANQD